MKTQSKNSFFFFKLLLLCMPLIVGCRFGNTMPKPDQALKSEAKNIITPSVEIASSSSSASSSVSSKAYLYGIENTKNLPRGVKAILSQHKSISEKQLSQEKRIALRPKAVSKNSRAVTTKSKSKKNAINEFGHTPAKFPIDWAGPKKLAPLRTNTQVNLKSTPSKTSASKDSKEAIVPANKVEPARARLKPAPKPALSSVKKEGISETLKKQTEGAKQAVNSALEVTNDLLSLGVSKVKKEISKASKELESTEQITKTETKPKEIKAEKKITTQPKSLTPTSEILTNEDSPKDIKVEKTEIITIKGDDKELASPMARLSSKVTDKLGGYSLLHEAIVMLGLLAVFFIVTWLRLEREYRGDK